MYEEIFDDFNVIKQYCERNENLAFEESLVFELLEKYFPKYGSQRSIQKVLDMLDTQRMRLMFSEDYRMADIENTVDNVKIENKTENINDSSIDIYNSESNDDSIIEVEVPKKIFPFIDLTNNSPDSDDIEEIPFKVSKNEESDHSTINDSDDNASDNYDYNWSDPDIVRHVQNDYTTDGSRFHDPPMLDLLADLESNDKLNNDTLDQASNIIENPEILEENNNDPNNNLEGAIFEEPFNTANVDDNNQTVEIIEAPDNSNSVLNMIDSIPGCSKDTDRDVINRIYNRARRNLPNVHSPLSPVAGYSKDFSQFANSSDNSDSDNSSFDYDDSLQNDVMSIQEIIPWAETRVILKLLKRNYMESKRKEITLWKLMERQTNKSSKIVKRKCNKSQSTSLELSPKKIKLYDNANHKSVEVISNKSSNDVMSSNEPIILKTSLEASNINQNYQQIMLQNNDQTNKIPTEMSDSKSITDKVIVHQNIFPMNPMPSQIVNSNVNNDVHAIDELDLITDYIEKDSKDQDILIESFKNSQNPFFKGDSSTFKLPVLPSQPGGSGLKSEKSSTIVRPSKLTLSQNPAPVDPRVHRGYMPLHPSRLNFLNPTHDNKKTLAGSNPAHQVKAKQWTPGLMKMADHKEEQPTGVLRKNPLWTQAQTSKTHREIAMKIIEQKLLKPSLLQGVVPLRELQMKQKQMNSLSAPTKVVNSQPIATVTSASIANQEIVQPIPPINQLNQASSNSNGTVDVQPSTSKPELDLTKKYEYLELIYVKLRSMFPEVKKSYIKEICVNPSVPNSNHDQQYILNSLIDNLLQEGSNNLEVKQIQQYVPEDRVSSLTVDEKYEYLVGIFPNADPTFLREFVEKETTSEQVIEDFIQEKIETHDYPTKQDYLNKIKVTEQIRQYTTNFNVENFLELFPEPIKHFEDKNRQNTYQLIAMEFLKSHFNKHKVCTINKIYRVNKYNLSVTARLLTEMGPDMKSKRGSSEMPTENIPLLQEIAFVKNKNKILDHIEAMKKHEVELFHNLKEKGLLLTCLCCYNDECMPTKSSECNAGHVFCYECIVRGTATALADGNAHVRCFTECQSEFSLATLQKVLPPTQFSSLLVKRQAAEVAAAAVEGLVSCPFCYFASIPPPEDKVFKCLNPECMKESCRLCKELNHIPLRCDEVIKSDKARLMIEEKMTAALLRTCYQCKKQFYKEDGCNKMSCPCGAFMCYVCDKPVKGYDHFNAQGGVNSNLCPLWSDDRRMNAEAVRKVAEEVKNSILKQNPNLKIDTESLLPKVPPKSRGPHDDIPNANQIHEHVRRVANAP